jgi:hypothetical protein
MRRILWCLFFTLLAVLICGCAQPLSPSPATAATPAATLDIPVTMPPAATTTVQVQKQINLTATKKPTEVIVQYNGGPDAADLAALNIRINNQNSQNVQRTITDPAIGAQYVFTYQGAADASVVNVVGVFRDGTEQTVLMAYL